MKPYLQSNGYVFNQDDGLWHRPEYEGLNYTDGDEIENRLKTIVSGASDVSVMSIELAKSCTDWPSRYHLSRVRVNLLRPFEERLQGKSVLEVGAGCGALTRYLGELGAEVVALEGSLRRASIVASRCRGLNNITVVGEVVHHFHPGPQFDVVTLIGVLEYARKFFPGNGADPVDAMLGYIKRLLRPGGTLIIAIENQLGLKYFAGFPEDHVGKSMFGIEEHYSQSGIVTFGRRELAGRVNQAGLPEQEWWFPFPDYKLPSLMVSDIGTLPPDGIDLTPVLRNACIGDPQYPPHVYFNQERALRPIVRNGLLGEVANSFVVLATDKTSKEKPTIPLAVHFATERRPEFAKKVVFTQGDQGAGYTSQVALYPTPSSKKNPLIMQRLVDQAFVKGELWQDRLIQIMTSPGWTVTQIEEWLKVWLDAFFDVVGIVRSCDITRKKISGQYLDLIPRNMIMDENGVPIFIDQEWVLEEELEVGYVIFRALFSSFYSMGGIAQTGERNLPSILCLIREIGQGLGLSFSDHEVKRYHNLECDFQQLVVGNSRLPYEVMAASRFRVSNTLSAHYGHRAETQEQIVVLKQTLLEREKQIAVLTQTVKDLEEQSICPKGVLSEREFAKKPLVSMIGTNGRNSPSEPKNVKTRIPSIVTGNGNTESRSSPTSYSPYVQTRYECSIIIPVCNRGDLTKQCLLHVAEVTQECHYEVIVVDNASTDGTKEFLSTLGGDIQVISNPKNFGFAKACNQGAAAAEGRFLVFLNNDTIPKAGWLRALVDEVQQHPDVAIVGSKLLYPNNTIQHAGVVFSKNFLGPYHIFNGAPADLPAVNVRRELQVVTAACFLIRREEFETIGGFDEGFRNGFEDVDLCLKIRERGRKVVYQPKSVLYHLESQTPGRKDPEMERHNGDLLRKRWASKIVVDEDLYTVPEGYANRYYYRDGWLWQSLKPFQSDLEKPQWKQVQRVQELLLSRRYDTTQVWQGQNDRELHALLSDDRIWPGDREVLRWAARLCQSSKLFEEERAFLKRILNLGEDRETREQLAKIALNVRDLSEAAHHVQALLRFDPNNGSGYWFQGILWMQSQQCADAIISFRQAIRCGYDPRKAGLGLGMACMGMGDPEEAWRIFEPLVADHPDDAEVMNWLIQSGASLQRWEALGQRLSRYVERNPADCDMRFALAGVEYRAGRMDSAKHQFEMLSLLKPGYEGLTDLGVLLQTAHVDVPVLTT